MDYLGVSESPRMVVLELSHGCRLGRHFSRELYCDAQLTKDGVTTLPVHRAILAAASTKFGRMFEGKDNKAPFVVPLVDFATLAQVVEYIYEGRVVFPSQVELEDFMTVLDIMKVDLEGQVTRVKLEVVKAEKEDRVIQEQIEGKTQVASKTPSKKEELNEEKKEVANLKTKHGESNRGREELDRFTKEELQC